MTFRRIVPVGNLLSGLWWLLATGGCSDPAASATAGVDGGNLDASAPDTDASDDADATVGCGAESPAALRACVDQTALTNDVALVAKERVPGSIHWQTVQDLCADRFAASGFTVERHDYGGGINVIGTLQGSSKAAEQIVVGAHYDHIEGCNGADDNASGVAALLEAARILPQSKFERTLVLACWDQEELGLLGSEAFATRAKAAGEEIVVALSLDPIGYTSTEPNSQTMPAGFEAVFPELNARLVEREFRGDWIGVIADENAATMTASFERHAGEIALVNGVLELATGLLASPLFSDLARSDHASFWNEGYPAIQLGDTGNFRNPNYHCLGGTRDDPETLDYVFLAQVTRAIVGSVAETLGPE